MMVGLKDGEFQIIILNSLHPLLAFQNYFLCLYNENQSFTIFTMEDK